MKKSMLYTGLAYLLAGIVCLGLAIAFEWKLDGLLWGLAGAGIGPGVMMIWKYFRWTRPQNRARYEEMLKRERIEMRDERKIMLRDKSGRITYQISMYLNCLLMFICSVCTVLEIGMPFVRYALFGLLGLLIFQYVCGLAVFAYLSRRL